MATLTVPKVLTHKDSEMKQEIDTKETPTVMKALQSIEDPELRTRLLKSSGDPREFLNVYINGQNVNHKQGLQTQIKKDDQMYVLPAISGGSDVPPTLSLSNLTDEQRPALLQRMTRPLNTAVNNEFLKEKEDIIFDVDGTLMDISERLNLCDAMYDKNNRRDTWWNLFLDDKMMMYLDQPNKDVVKMAHRLHKAGHNILVCSARTERHRITTLWQLNKLCKMDWIKGLWLRKDNDRSPDNIVKREMLKTIRSQGFNPAIAFDDRNSVVNTWRSLGVQCYQVREGGF